MKILIDGDSCSVLGITEKLAKRYSIPCHVYCDTSRTIKTNYSQVHIVDCSQNAADFAIISACSKNDIVVTNDSGLAALVLAKKGVVVNTFGNIYTDTNIIGYLNRKYIRQVTVRHTKRKQVRGKLYDPFPEQKDYRKVLIELIQSCRTGRKEAAVNE